MTFSMDNIAIAMGILLTSSPKSTRWWITFCLENWETHTYGERMSTFMRNSLKNFDGYHRLSKPLTGQFVKNMSKADKEFGLKAFIPKDLGGLGLSPRICFIAKQLETSEKTFQELLSEPYQDPFVLVHGQLATSKTPVRWQSGHQTNMCCLCCEDIESDDSPFDEVCLVCAHQAYKMRLDGAISTVKLVHMMTQQPLSIKEIKVLSSPDMLPYIVKLYAKLTETSVEDVNDDTRPTSAELDKIRNDDRCWAFCDWQGCFKSGPTVAGECASPPVTNNMILL
jgi:hypothetical protein